MSTVLELPDIAEKITRVDDNSNKYETHVGRVMGLTSDQKTATIEDTLSGEQYSFKNPIVGGIWKGPKQYVVNVGESIGFHCREQEIIALFPYNKEMDIEHAAAHWDGSLDGLP